MRHASVTRDECVQAAKGALAQVFMESSDETILAVMAQAVTDAILFKLEAELVSSAERIEELEQEICEASGMPKYEPGVLKHMVRELAESAS